MGTKTGELRETLMEAIDLVKQGKMDSNRANAIAKLAAQVSASLAVELSIRQSKLLGAAPLGALLAGQPGEVIENAPARQPLPGSSVFVHRIADDETEAA